ncbi:hypothetical protein GQ457_10G008270 [Hibiscus cannabinus]
MGEEGARDGDTISCCVGVIRIKDLREGRRFCLGFDCAHAFRTRLENSIDSSPDSVDLCKPSKYKVTYVVLKMLGTIDT